MLTQPFSQEQSIYSLGAARTIGTPSYSKAQTIEEKMVSVSKIDQQQYQKNAAEFLAKSRKNSLQDALALVSTVDKEVFKPFVNAAEKIDEKRLLSAVGKLLGIAVAKQLTDGSFTAGFAQQMMDAFSKALQSNPSIIKKPEVEKLLDLDFSGAQLCLMLMYICPTATAKSLLDIDL
jgi:hypothetical protein